MSTFFLYYFLSRYIIRFLKQQYILQMMKIVFFSSFNFSLELTFDVSARCSSHPQGENGN